MTAALHLATIEDLDRVVPLVAAYHAYEGIEQDDAARRGAIEPLLKGSEHGALWLIGPRRAPVGYIAISFGWSIELGGLDGIIDEFFMRENVRGRGMGTEVLRLLLKQLSAAGMKALSLEVAPENARATKLYARRGFVLRDGYNFMTWRA